MNAPSGAIRAIDRIDTAPPFTAHDAVAAQNNLFRGSDTLATAQGVLKEGAEGESHAVSMLGAESAVLRTCSTLSIPRCRCCFSIPARFSRNAGLS